MTSANYMNVRIILLALAFISNHEVPNTVTLLLYDHEEVEPML